MNWFLVRLLILVFLGSIAVVRRAQNEFYTNGEGDSVHNRLPSVNVGNSKAVDDLHIQKVISILQGNIKQWSFIESQLLEPNVNVGMPEIAIPLRHLTTTLEVLGNIFFAQNDLQAARASLERACPLKELLPASPSVEEEVYATGIGDPLLDAATLGSMLWSGSAAAGGQPEPPDSLGGTVGADSGSNSYAAGCFALLKDVYDKLYGKQLQPQTLMADAAPDPAEGGALSVAVQLDGQLHSSASSASGPTATARPSPARLRSASHNSGYQSHLLPNGRPREFNLKYMLSQTQQRQQMKQRRQLSSQGGSAAGVAGVAGVGEVRAPRVSGAKLSMAAATAGPAYREKSASAASAATAAAPAEPSGADAADPPVSEPGHRRRDHALLMDSDGGATLYTMDEPTSFDADQAIRALRAPFVHLRAELGHRGHSDSPSPVTGGAEHDTSTGDAAGRPTDNRLPPSPSASSGRRGAGLGLGLSAGSQHTPSVTVSPATPAPTLAVVEVRGFEGSALNSISGEEITLPGVSTAIIADDLELLLRKFVRATRRARRDLARQATKYFDELDINFPNMDYGEYAANMDLGQAFLEVMHRAAEEGLTFVALELEAWRVPSHSSQAADTGPLSGSGSGSGSGAGSRKGDSNSALDALETQYGLKFRAAGGKRADSDRKKLTKAEKNRLLVLYAFDIVHADPNDPFDLGLGFNRAIADNDRSRKGATAALGGYDLAAGLTAEAFSEAVESLRSALKGDLGGLLGGAGDDAHRRLFPFDPLTAADGRNSQRLAEQHLRDLLLLEGGAEAYLAAKSAAVRNKAASEGASVPKSGKTAGKRRRQRQQAVGGDGEYSVSGEGVPAGSVPATSGIKAGAGSSGDTDPEGADYFDDAAGATVGILSSSTLRSSVPTLGPEGAEWTLSLFLLFMVLTGAVVYSANQEAARKKMIAGRNRLRQVGGASGPSGGGKKTGSAGWVSGSSVVDFMYAQLGVVGGAPGANAAADWDDAAQTQIAAENERTQSGSAAVAQHPPSGAAGASAGSASLFSASLNALMLGSRASPQSAGTAARTAGVSGKGRKGKDGQIASSDGARGTEDPLKPAGRSTLLGDLFSLVSTAVPSSASVDASKGSDLSAPQNGKRRDSPRAEGSSNELSSKLPSNGTSTTAPNNASVASHGAGSANTATGSTSSRGKKGKNKDQKVSNGVCKENGAKPGSSSQPSPRQLQKLHVKDSMNRSQPSSDSLASTASSNGSGSSDSDGGKSKPPLATAAPFNPPVVLNNRRVSWAGLIPTSPGEGIAEQDGSEGDWAEARKKSRHKHAVSGPTGEEGSGTSHAPAVAPRSDRIALSLKESPLYRHPPARPAPPRPVYSGSGARPATAAGPGGGASNAAAAAAAAANSARPLQAAYRPVLPAPGPVHGGGRPPGGPAVPPEGSGGGALPALRNRTLYDLSEAKLLAEQMGGWSVSGSSSSAASPHSRGPDIASPGPSPRAAAQLPPGLPRVNPARSTLGAATDTTASANSHAKPGGGTSTAFGFSQFDINRLGGSAGLYAGASPFPWAATSTAGTTTGLASAAQLDSEPLVRGGEYAGSALAGDLADYASLLLSGSSASAGTAAPGAPATGSGATSAAEYAAYYGGGAESVAYDPQQYQGYYGDQQGAEADHYYYQSAEDQDQLFYGDYGDSHYGAYGLGLEQEQGGGYSGYGVAETEEPRSVWGTRSSGTAKVTSHDLTASSITSEASAVYALSPDAPSFRPSQKLLPPASQPARAPVVAAATATTTTTTAHANRALPQHSAALDLGFADLLLSAQASTVTGYSPQSQSQMQQSPASAQDASDDFFQSYLIDSILGGEELSRSVDYDD